MNLYICEICGQYPIMKFYALFRGIMLCSKRSIFQSSYEPEIILS